MQLLSDPNEFKRFLQATIGLISGKSKLAIKVYYSILFLGKSICSSDEIQKIILLCISMEYLFSGEKQNNNRLIITTHITSIISKSMKERKGNSQIISNFFDLRNDIVHGKSYITNQDTVDKFMDVYKKAVVKEVLILSAEMLVVSGQ